MDPLTVELFGKACLEDLKQRKQGYRSCFGEEDSDFEEVFEKELERRSHDSSGYSKTIGRP